MEHVEGKPLSALIPADGLPPESVIPYMPLQPGTTLGPYEVLTAIGAGGMGEVEGRIAAAGDEGHPHGPCR